MALMYLLWVLFLIPALLIEVFCWITSPIVAFFYTKESRLDWVKRKQGTYAMQREYIVRPLRWWQTHDNAVDEYWYGMYNEGSWLKVLREASQEQYDNYYWIRYLCRLMWMWRNTAYGFHYALFGTPVEEKSVKEWGSRDSTLWLRWTHRKNSFQVQAKFPLPFWCHNDINIGWKEHRGFPKLMYANRIIGIRKNNNARLS